jgi:hypothetical protein
MNSICRVLAVTAVSIAAGFSAQAQTPTATGAAAAPPAPPIPTLHCDFKALNSCAPDGTCKEGGEVPGIKAPVKVTVDFENSVVGSVDESGYARTDKFDSVAYASDQLIVHGIDGAFGWQLLIAKNSEAASMTFATADATIGGFGTCTSK